MPNFFPGSFWVWIKGFHMPLFFFVSGYFAKSEVTIQKVGNKIKQKAVNILLAYVCYSVIFAGLECVALGMNFKVFIERMYSMLNGNGGYYMLWFLFSLFLVESLFYIITYITYISRRESIRGILFLGCVCMAILLKYIFHYNGYKIGTSLYAIGFFYLGYLWKEKQLLIKFSDMRWNIVLVIVNIVGTIFMILNGHVLEMVDNQVWDIVMNYMVAISAIIVTLNISQWLVKYRISYILEYIGVNSLYFYPLTGYIPDLAKIVLGESKIIKVLSRFFSFVFTYGIIEMKKILMLKNKLHGSH